MLEIRLNILYDYVDKFVIAEGEETLTGKPKPAYLLENQSRFDKFSDKIKYLTVPATPSIPCVWSKEAFHRNCLIEGTLDAKNSDFILLSDLDEIPDLLNYKGEEGVFRQKMYYYAFNVFTGRRYWHGTIAVCRKNIIGLNDIRQKRRHTKIIPGASGWHFSDVCSAEQIIYKLESWGHQEFNTFEIKSKIEERRNKLVDPYGRQKYKGTFKIEDPSGPDWLLNNKERYRHLFYKDDYGNH